MDSTCAKTKGRCVVLWGLLLANVITGVTCWPYRHGSTKESILCRRGGGRERHGRFRWKNYDNADKTSSIQLMTKNQDRHCEMCELRAGQQQQSQPIHWMKVFGSSLTVIYFHVAYSNRDGLPTLYRHYINLWTPILYAFNVMHVQRVVTNNLSQLGQHFGFALAVSSGALLSKDPKKFRQAMTIFLFVLGIQRVGKLLLWIESHVNKPKTT